jgi:hypothetical protein
MVDPVPAAEPARPPRPPEDRGHGCLVAAGMMLGPVVGWSVGQVALGLVGGLAIGIVAAAVMTWRDRRR